MLRKGERELRIGCEPSRTDFHNILQIDWQCPPRFLVDPIWKMEAGSESQEIHIQLQRESTADEATYHHNSDIPPNPYVASNALDLNDGSIIPVIPLDVINDDTSPNDPLIPPGPTVKVAEVIGAAVALVALIKSKETGSQIDLELLIQLLCNPGMLLKLMKDHGLSANQSSVITRVHPHERSPGPLLVPPPAVGGYTTWSPSAPFTQNPSSNKKVDVGKIKKLINEYGVNVREDDSVKPGPAVVKDAGHYRRLILLHGMSQQNDKPQGFVKPSGSREQRQCVYFNSPKGCRHGSGCRFLHVKGGFRGNPAVEELHGVKRVKLSGESFANFG